MQFRWIPEGPRKIGPQLWTKMKKIYHFGGPSENCQKHVLGRVNNVQKISTYCPGTTFWWYFDKTWTQKMCRRPRPYFYQNIIKKVSPDNTLIFFGQCWPSRGHVFDNLTRVLPGSRFWIFWLLSNNVPETLSNPSKLANWHVFGNFAESPEIPCLPGVP